MCVTTFESVFGADYMVSKRGSSRKHPKLCIEILKIIVEASVGFQFM